jgi:hypothetical protein
MARSHVWHLDADGVEGQLRVRVGTVRFEIVACGTGVGNGKGVTVGWGTAKKRIIGK